MGLNMKLLFTLSVLAQNLDSTSHHYPVYDLSDSKKLCRKNHELSLGKDGNSSIIVNSTNLIPSSREKDFQCEFTVTDPFNMGIFAVIQRMSFRKNASSNECIDYLQIRHKPKPKFSKPLTFVSRPWEKELKYCGTLGKFEQSYITSPNVSVPAYLAPNAMVDRNGNIEVKIFVKSTKGHTDEDSFVELAFTSFKTCNGNEGGYRFCGNRTCIHKDFFDDNIVNCPFKDCADESECRSGDPKIEGASNLNTKVTVTAVTSIFLSFFLFLACIWLCRHFDLLCCTHSYEERHSPALRELTGPIDSEPTAPPLPSPDKDLPPPYHTLFPER